MLINHVAEPKKENVLKLEKGDKISIKCALNE